MSTIQAITFYGVLSIYIGSLYSEILTKQDICFEKIASYTNILPVAIIGGGPAGLNAALYCARARVHAVVFGGEQIGGQLMETTYVENWPGLPKALGSDIIQALMNQAKRYNALISSDSIVRVDFAQWPYCIYTSSGEKVHALTVLIATGAQPRRLGVPGEDEYWGKGVSTCALCDGPCLQTSDVPDKHVIIVGGGDAAIEQMMQLASYARSITILVRSQRMRALPSMKEYLADYPHVQVIYNKEIQRINGNGEYITSVDIIDTITHEHSQVSTDAVFLAIGSVPQSDLFKDYLKTNRLGYISVSPYSQETSLPGIFAAGDVEDSQFKQVSIALGRGGQMALEAIEFLRAHGYTDKIAQELSSHYYTCNCID